MLVDFEEAAVPNVYFCFRPQNNEIRYFQKKLKALEKQKRGLMQKLLTGEVRVK